MNQLFHRLSSRKKNRRRNQDDKQAKVILPGAGNSYPSMTSAVITKNRWMRQVPSQDLQDVTHTTEDSINSQAVSVQSLVSSPETMGSTASASNNSPSSVMAPFVSFVTLSKMSSEEENTTVSCLRDGDDNSNGYHRYDDDVDDENFDVDYRGHYVARQEHHDPVVRMALQACQQALQPERSISTPAMKKCAALATQQQQQRHEDTCQSLDASGNVLYEQGKLGQAFQKYEEALQLKRQSLLEECNAMQLAGTSKEERARILASIATSINNLAYLRQVSGRASTEETLASYEAALQIKRESLGPDHLSVGKTLNNIGSVQFLHQNYHEAAASYEHARDILQMNLGREHLDVCTVTSNLGDVHNSMGQLQRAANYYREAVQLRWKLLGPTDPKVVRLMEQIAELEMIIDKTDDAKDDETLCSESYYGPMLTDVHSLQAELQRDLQHMDLLEHQMPIDMIKDKARVFREIRELRSVGDGDSDSALDVVLSCFDCSSDDSPCGLPFKVLGEHIAAPMKVASYPDLTAKASYSESLAIVGTSSNASYQTQATSMTTCPSSDSVDNDSRLESEVTKMNAEDVEQNAPLTLDSPTASFLSDSTRDHSLLSSPSSIDANNRDSSAYKFLTSEERKQALASVRERLAKLRAAREFRTDGRPPIDFTNNADAASRINQASYRDPTTSAWAKGLQMQTLQASSPSMLIKTSELLTMKQGINSLRGFSTEPFRIAGNTVSFDSVPAISEAISATGSVSHVRRLPGTRRTGDRRMSSAPRPALLK